MSWFVWAFVGSSALTLMQLTVAGNTRLPLALAFQAALVFQTFILFTQRPFLVSTSSGIRNAICLMIGTGFLAVLHASLLKTNSIDLPTSFLFMYSLGLATAVFVAGPATVRLTRPIILLLLAAFAFGLAQATRHNLFLPESFKAEYGIRYETFVNGATRVLGFLPSAPRFAELAAFALVFLIFSVIEGAPRRAARFAGCLVLLYLLYNTFSRSGYLLLVVSLLFLLFYGHATLSKRHDGRLSLAYFSAVFALLLGAIYLAFSPAVSDLAIADSTSLAARQGHWDALKSAFDAAGSSAYLFGTGRSAHANAFEEEYFVIDNVFYAYLYFGGVVCLAAVALLYYRTLKSLLAARGDQPGATPLAAFLSALPVEGLFLDNHNTLMLTLFIAIGILNRYALQGAGARQSSADPDPIRSFAPRQRHSDDRVGQRTPRLGRA